MQHARRRRGRVEVESKDTRKTMDKKEQALFALSRIFSIEGDHWTCGNLVLILAARGAGKQRELSKAMYDFAMKELGGARLPPEVFED